MDLDAGPPIEWGRLRFSFAQESRNDLRSVRTLESTRMSDIEIWGDNDSSRIAIIQSQIGRPPLCESLATNLSPFFGPVAKVNDSAQLWLNFVETIVAGQNRFETMSGNRIIADNDDHFQ